MKIKYEAEIKDCGECPLIKYDGNGHANCPYGLVFDSIYGTVDTQGRKAIIPYHYPTDIRPCPIEIK